MKLTNTTAALAVLFLLSPFASAQCTGTCTLTFDLDPTTYELHVTADAEGDYIAHAIITTSVDPPVAAEGATSADAWGGAHVEYYAQVPMWNVLYIVSAGFELQDEEWVTTFVELERSVWAGEDPPAISRISFSNPPIRGNSGTVTISGFHLASPAGPTWIDMNQIYTGNVSGDARSISAPFSISQSTPAGAYDLSVTTPFGTATAAVTVYDPPVTVSCPSPWQAGWTNYPIFFNGTGFGSNPTIQLTGDSNVSFTVTAANDEGISGNVTIPSNDPGALVTATVAASGLNGQSYQGYQSASSTASCSLTVNH